MKRNYRLFLCILLSMSVLLLSGCDLPSRLNFGKTSGSGESISKSGFYFNTVITVTLYGTKDETLLDDCFSLADTYENYFSNTIADSDVSKINAAGGAPVTVHEETAELIKKGLYYGDLSNGKFDITIGKLSDLWDISTKALLDQTDASMIPSDDEIKKALTTVDYQNVVVDGNTVTLKDPSAKIDLGGIAKGYIADRMKDYRPREILKKTIEKVEKEGYTFQIDPECEFFLFHEDENGVPTTVTHEKAGYMDISPLDLGENARRDMVMTLEDMGFEIESSHHEKAPGQHEIDFRYAGAMETADRIVTFKTAVRSIAKRFGLYATFMPKPKAGTAGSGMHINISLFQNGKNIFSDPEAEDGLSQEAKWFMGGIMAHVKGMCAVTNPLVNSYKRLTSGCDAPRDIIWTTKNHNTLLRIPFMRGEDTRIELRFPDPSANAYLTIALCMAAGLDGIAKHLDPGAESARLFASRTEAEKAAAGIDHLPDTLREAVAFMEEDSFVKMVLGQEFVDLYVEAKKAEWNEYMSQVSEWEVDKYLYRT